MGFKTYISKYIIIVFVLFTQVTFAQTDFKKERAQFTVELKQKIYPYLHANVYKEGKRFIQNFNTKKNKEIDTEIIKLFKDVYKLHLSVSEDYVDFFNLLNAYYSKKIDKDKTLQLITLNRRLLNLNRVSESKLITKRVSIFLKSKQLYSNSHHYWKTKNDKWEFEFEFEPLIVFSKTDLVCSGKNDDFEIKNTKGSFNVLTNTFYGMNGLVKWKNHSRKVELSTYEMELNRVYFEAERASLTDKSIYNETIKGTFSYRMSLVDETWKALEPQFISTEVVPIKNYAKGIKIQSGIHIKGNQLDLLAPKGSSSVIEFIKNNKTFVRLRAQKFTLENDQFFSRQSMFELYLKGDTISHPSIDLKFDLKAQKMHAKTSNTQFGHSPFYNGLHKLQIVADHLYWEKEKNNLIFQNNQTSRLEPVVYQSLRFFDKNWFLDLFNFDLQHPTTPLLRLTKANAQTREFDIYQIQETYKFNELSDAENLMVEFTNQGFVNFNPFEGKVYIQDRFFSFVTALNKDEDFDRIRFKSNVNNRPSGVIDLETGILEVQVVKEIHLSLKNDVTIYPEDKTVQIFPNMDMEFNGTTLCGKFGFFGKNQKFDYDLYEIQFNEIDSFRYLLDIANPEDTGIYIHPCKTVLQEFTGTLEIDKPENKSSKQKTKSFPIIRSTEKSYVYYDKVKGGLYPRNEFYFEADEFVLNTILVQKTEELTFPGVLKSGGIFDDIKETLVLNKNEELGFVRDQKMNYGLYENSTYSNYLRLTNSGLFGRGQIIEQDLVLYCDSIDFYPSYLYAEIGKMSNASTTDLNPNITAEKVKLDWFVDENWMEFKNRKNPFTINSRTNLNGGIEFDMNSFTAFGTLVEENIVLKSDSMKLNRDLWNATDAHIKIYPENVKSFYEHEIVLENSKIDLEFDYSTRSLINTDDESNHKFYSPFLKFNFTYPLFSYEMDNSEMYFEGKDSDTTQSFLNITESLNPFTGNIKYISPTSIIEMKTLEVVLVDIEGVQIADALIRPAGSELKLLSSGLPEKLTSAKIDLLNTKGELNYTFQNAEVSIISGDDYLANADFVYNNRLGEEQIVRFDNLAVNDQQKTFGEASVEKESEFNLDPNMNFEGLLSLNPEENHRMLLDGTIVFNDPCLELTSVPFIYQDSLVDQNTIIKTNKDKKANQPKASFLFNTLKKDYHIGMTGFSENENETSLIELNGDFSFLDSTDNYEIYNNENEYGLAKFSAKSCSYELEGFSNLSHHKLIPELSYSRFLLESDQPDSLVFQSHFGLNLPLPAKALKIFRKEVYRKTKSNETTYENSELFRNFLYNLIGESATSKYFKAKRRGRNYVPTPMQASLFITDIDFEWNSESKYFEHTGNIELNQIDGKKIDRIVGGYIKYRPGKKGDYWHIYIELAEDEFFYFEISNDVIYTYSSNNKFNKTIQKKKKNITKKKSKLLIELTPYFDQIPKNID